jgi:hypothetical protein
VVCEGLTEATFVHRVLAPYVYSECSVELTPSLLKSGTGRSGGGNVTVERLANHMAREYHNFDGVTSLVDWYGFSRRDADHCTQLEERIRQDVEYRVLRVDTRKLLPYVQLHEFEALLFADVEGFRICIDGWSTAVEQYLRSVREQFKSPEDINDNPSTCPSARIAATFGEYGYQKASDGPLVAEEVGIPAMRSACPRFDAWLKWLERFPMSDAVAVSDLMEE